MQTQTINRTLLVGAAAIALGAFYFGAATPAEAQLVRNAVVSSSTVPRLDVSCMSEAVGEREDALATAWTGFNEDITTALTARKAALMDAWDKETTKKRTTAVKAAWKAWKASSKTAHTELRKERKSAWDTFKKAAKSECKMNMPQEEALEKSNSDTVTL
jgi:hypothetical protein